MSYPMLDWRKPELYPKAENLDQTEWAWEFLRRNPAYQDDYAVYESIPSYDEQGNGIYGGWQEPYLSINLDDYHGCIDPPHKPGETYAEYRERNKDVAISVIPFAGYMCDKYGFFQLFPNPRDKLGENCWFSDTASDRFPIIPPEHINESIIHWATLPEQFHGDESLIKEYREQLEEHWIKKLRTGDDRHHIFCFDLRFSINHQIRHVKKALEEAKREAKKEWGLKEIRISPQIDRFPDYIRLLDAELDGASYDSMAEVLFPYLENDYPDHKGRRKAKDQLKKAKEMAEIGYWYLSKL